ncbi:MAG TPA: site-2 protease family protein [Solirubrobacteraceae bacterium]|jgi:Zn-dependent protease|nr:site-2 protease family protein [Solirubrobacteraceae bacterium]
MLRRPGSIKLMDVFGIRIGVDGTWFIFLFLVIFWLSSPFRNTLHSSDTVAYITTVVTVLLFFCSLIIHELGHAIAARRQGIGVHRIELFLFGGLTQMSRDTTTPAEELKVAIAGPLGTLVFLLVCLVVDLAIVGPSRLWHAVRLNDTIQITPVLLSLSWLLAMNVVILAFNLVPAFPLDGGRIARALVWRRTGDKLRGTRVAAKLGQGFAIVLAGAGIGWLLAGDTLNGLWLIALAFMMGQSARGALVQTALSQRIDGVTVADIMDRQPVAIPLDTPVSQALDEYFLRYGWSWFPVVDERGRFAGVALQDRLQATIDGGESWLTVGSVLESAEDGRLGVSEDQRLTEVMSSEALGRFGALMAVDGEGVLQGVVTIEQIRRALQTAFGGSRTA